MNDKKDMIEKVKVFLEIKTYVYVKTQNQFFNGYVQSISKNFFLFQDDEITNPIPIFFEELIKIEPSTKKEGK